MENFDQLFGDLDKENENVLDILECYKVLDGLGITFYQGMLQRIFESHIEPITDTNKISKEMLRRYCYCCLKGLQLVPEMECQLGKSHREFQQLLKQAKEGQGASAGASPGEEYRQQNYSVSLQIGPDTEYNSHLNIQVTKFKEKKHSNPVLRISFAPKPNKADQLVATLNEIVTKTKNLLNFHLQQYYFLIDSVKAEAKKVGENVVLEIFTDCEEVNGLLEGMVEFPDKLVEEVTEGTLKISIGTNANLEESFNAENTFLDFLLKSLKVSIQYHGSASLTRLYESLGLIFNSFAAHHQYSQIKHYLQDNFFGASISLFQDLDIHLKFNSLENFKQTLETYYQHPIPQLQTINNEMIVEMVQGITMLKEDHDLSFIPQAIHSLVQQCEAGIEARIEVGKSEISLSVSLANLEYLYKKVLEQLDNSK